MARHVRNPDADRPVIRKRRRRRKAPALICVLAAALVAAGVAYAVLGWRDPGARRGFYEGKTPEEIQRDLDAQVDWYAMEISVAGAMEVVEGGTQVEARIENAVANHCDQKVRMYLTDDPSDVLFESGAICPGDYLQYVELAHALPVGRHDVTVEFQGYERDISLVSDEGALFGHDRFGASCAAQVALDVRPMGA